MVSFAFGPKSRLRLEKIPQVSVEVLEHSYCPVALFLWFAHESNAFGFIGSEVAPKVVGVKKQKHPATSLIADA